MGDGNEVVIHIKVADDTAAGTASSRANVTKQADALATDLDKRLTDAGSKAGGHLGDGVSRGATDGMRDASRAVGSAGGDIESALKSVGSKGGRSMASSLAASLNNGLSGMLSGGIGGFSGPQLGALIAGGIVLGGPLVAGAMSAVMTTGVVAAGAAIQRNSPLIQQTWHGVVGDLGQEAQQASQVMVAPIAEGLEQIKSNLSAEGPSFQSMFTSAAADVPILTRGIDALIDNSLPGLQSMVASSGPILNGLADAAGSVGSGISDLGNDIAGNSGTIGKDLHDMGDDAKVMIDALGQLTVAGSNFFHEFSPEIKLVTEGVKSFSTGLSFLSTVAPHAFNIGDAGAGIAQLGASIVGSGQAAQTSAQQTKTYESATQEAEAGVNSYGSALQALGQSYTTANAGAKFLEDSHDQATITAGTAVQSWQQLQQQVTSAGMAYSSAAQSVASAEHSVVTAEEGVASARHAEQQATLQVQSANDAYKESLYEQKQAQEAVTDAEKAAEQQLVSLKLQAESAATSQLSANDALFKASQEASKFGIDNSNVRQIAAMASNGQENAGNAAEVEAAIALLEAQNQLAQAQNSNKTSQDQLNTARQQGVSGNPAVLAAEHALAQANLGVKSASEGVAEAEYAQRQAARQVADAEYGVQQASQAVTTARQQEEAAERALTTARDAASRSIDQNTLAGAKNRQSIESIFEAYVAGTGSQQEAAKLTENIGTKMGFTKSQIDHVIKSLQGLDGTHANFGLNGTPSLNMNVLEQQAKQVFQSAQNFLGFAAGGSTSGLAWVGEQGPELVNLPAGSTVIPNSNSMQMLAAGDAPFPGFAAGGPVGSLSNPMSALAVMPSMAADWGAYDTLGQTAHIFGGPAVKLPPPNPPVLSSAAFAGGAAAGSGLRGSRAANEAIVQQIWASMFGWRGSEWAATVPLIMQESGFNNTAQNPTSTAYGMFQFLNSTWGGYGIPKTSDPTLQSIAGGRYIKARYGDPIGALGHERAFNWYGNGGPASGRAGVGDRGRELVRIPGAGGGGAANLHVTAELVVGSGGNSQLGSFITYLVRTGVIRLTVAADGKTVKAG